MADGPQAVKGAELTKVKRGLFYGWWIALASFVTYFLSGGFFYYGFNTFFIPLEQEFGWSRTILSGAFSLSRLEGGLAGPIAGYVIDRFGPRRVMAFGLLAMGAGFILFSRIDSLLTFYLVFVVLISLGCSLGLSSPALITVAKWFVRKRGLAIGLAMSGTGLGGLLLPLLGWIIVEYGWRAAAVFCGLAIWVVGFPLIAVMRQKPERYGQFPDGIDPAVSRGASKEFALQTRGLQKGEATALEQNFTVKQALHAPIFWLMALAFGLRQLVIGAIAIHEIPLLVDMGISQGAAAGALGAMAIVSIPGRMGFGWLGDRYDKKKVMASTTALVALGCLILANLGSFWQIIPFLVFYAPAYGGGASLMFALRGEYFGRESFGTISGLMDFIQMFGLVLGPLFAGYVYDVTGSYQTAFYVFAAAASIATVICLFLRKPKLPAAAC